MFFKYLLDVEQVPNLKHLGILFYYLLLIIICSLINLFI